jgi:C4-dicarboxylate transporter, DctM subunit
MNPPPSVVSRGLAVLHKVELSITFAAFAVLAAVIFADVLMREFTGSGLSWARQIGVYANVVVTIIGIGLASDGGAHLRPRFADRWLPAAWDPWLVRLGELLTAAFCLAFAWVAFTVVRETYELDERSIVLRLIVWPVQSVLPAAFAIAALRHACFGLWPALRPAERGEGDPHGEPAAPPCGGRAAMTGAGLALLVLALLALRQSLMVVLGCAAAYAYLAWGDGVVANIVLDGWDALNRDVLLSIPLYLLAGNIMAEGAIATRLVRFMRAVTGPVPGGLAIATVLSCAIFAAIVGSSAVTLLAVGSIMYPALLAAGYSRSFSLGIVCAGGTLGIIIPPSIPLILYGVMTNTSIADLFLAGVGPGLLLVGLFAAYSIAVNWQRRLPSWNLRELRDALSSGAWSLMLPVIILGGIYSGYFTATESAAVALVYALFVEMVIHRELDLRALFRVTGDTTRLLGSLFPVLMMALSLNVFLSYQQVPEQIVGVLSQWLQGPTSFLIVTNLLLLAVGAVMDIGSAILILAPILQPVAQAQGLDPVHFGIMMTVNLEIGYLTPPMGLNLIVAMSAFREDFWVICRAVLPFMLIMLVALVIVATTPQLSLFLLR